MTTATVTRRYVLRTLLFGAGALALGCKCGGSRQNPQVSRTSAPQAPQAPSTTPITAPVQVQQIDSANIQALLPHYNAWKTQFIKTLADGSALVIDPSQNNRAVSEGFGYGMLLAVDFNDRTTFDALLKGYQKNVETAGSGLSIWLMDSNGNLQDDSNAIDADIDTSLALLKANQKWGEASYQQTASRIISTIGDKALKTVNGKTYLLPSGKAYEFIKGEDFIINPSYFNLTAFRQFAQIDSAHNWQAAVDSSYEILSQAQAQFGFIPDWLGLRSNSGQIFELTREYCSQRYLFDSNQRLHIFGNDAVRVLWQLSQDHRSSQDPRAREILNKVLAGTSPTDTKVQDAWSNDAWHNEIAGAAFALAAEAVDHPQVSQYLAQFQTFDRGSYYGTWDGAQKLYYNQAITLLMNLGL